MEIPLFPLHVVLVPGAPLPLHIFEPRYRTLVADCLAAGARFGVVCISAGREVGAGSVAFASVGTLAEIREASRYPDGRYDIVTVGTTRFRLSDVVADRKPYLIGIGEPLPEVVGDEERTALLARRVRSRFVRYLELLQPVDEDDAEDAGGDAAGDLDAPPGTMDDAALAVDPGRASAAFARLEEIAARLAPPDDPSTLAHVVSGLVQVELPRRQRLLEAATTEERLADLDGLLAREIALLARRLGPYDPDPRLPTLRRN
jgi:ATP-dependent Lon protease